ncbi:MAG: hypothetical protein ACRDG7_08885 [Candidatus Limnocylindria bacterium]
MTPDREVLALVPIANDPEVGIQHEAERRFHVAWLRDTHDAR